MSDMLVRVDLNDNQTGLEEKIKCHLGSGLLHRAFSVFIFNSAGELLIQQRSRKKMLWPLFWSNSCCSHPQEGEGYEEAAQRRLMEECGIRADLKIVYRFHYTAKYKDTGSENELCTVLTGFYDGEDLKIDPSEIADYKWIGLADLLQEMETHPEIFTPWFRMEINELTSEHNQIMIPVARETLNSLTRDLKN